MKRILILGKGSYVGDSFVRYLEKFGDDYRCDVVDTVGDEWKNTDFSGYDAVYQVAGLAHLKETPELEEEYYYINCNLAVECARMAKAAGVPLFVYLSSISVYDPQPGVISKDDSLSPVTYYGKSKLKAERELSILADDSFRLAILRPPMVYGYGCKGNFPTLVKFAEKCPLFPEYKNRRSMIYIDNLCEFVRRVIDEGEGGLFFPHNSEYVCTSDMVRAISAATGKKIRFTKVFNPIITLVKKIVLIRKVFGDLCYDFDDDGISVVDFEKSVRISVTGEQK